MISQVFSNSIEPYTIYHQNSAEYHQLKREIFGQHCYYVELETQTPTIIDAGAHIGLATLYFKKLYPQARITALEPNPETFNLLKKNIEENRLENVTPIMAGLAAQIHPAATLYRDRTLDHWWSTAGFIKGAWNGTQQSEPIQVETISLQDIVQNDVIDLLKMDIEGAEQSVLQASPIALSRIKNIIIEFHPHSQQNLDTLISLLSPIFQLEVKKDGVNVPQRKATGLVMIEGKNRHYH